MVSIGSFCQNNLNGNNIKIEIQGNNNKISVIQGNNSKIFDLTKEKGFEEFLNHLNKIDNQFKKVFKNSEVTIELLKKLINNLHENNKNTVKFNEDEFITKLVNALIERTNQKLSVNPIAEKKMLVSESYYVNSHGNIRIEGCKKPSEKTFKIYPNKDSYFEINDDYPMAVCHYQKVGRSTKGCDNCTKPTLESSPELISLTMKAGVRAGIGVNCYYKCNVIYYEIK